jgi:hypothetical protein
LQLPQIAFARLVLSLYLVSSFLIRRAPTAVCGTLGLKYQHTEEANGVAACLKNQFTAHHLFDENRDQLVEARIQA